MEPLHALPKLSPKASDPRDVPNKNTSLANFDVFLANPKKPVSIKDSATERSKALNVPYGLFFSSGGLYVGYALGILGPLGEKWLKFNFGITDDAALFYGMANLG